MTGPGRLIRRRAGHTTLPNATVLDDRLTFRALGLLVALLARPWGASFDMRSLAAGEGREGRDAVLTAAAELRAAGYLHQTRRRLPSGLFVTDTYVADEPVSETEAGAALQPDIPPTGVGFPDPGSPDPGLPDPGLSDRLPKGATPGLARFARKPGEQTAYVRGRETPLSAPPWAGTARPPRRTRDTRPAPPALADLQTPGADPAPQLDQRRAPDPGHKKPSGIPRGKI